MEVLYRYFDRKDVRIMIEGVTKYKESFMDVHRTEVQYWTGYSWKDFLILGNTMSSLSVQSSTCYFGRDWGLQKMLSILSALAFEVYGTYISLTSKHPYTKENFKGV